MSESDTKWAACIVYYEDEKALKELISDLLNQSLKPTEIFIADNNSIKSPELGNNSNITIIKLSKNLGFGSAANCAIKSAIENDFEKFILFSQDVGICITADALWENGFGVVFPEIEGEEGYDDVRASLDLIESLQASIIFPGHGAPFTDVAEIGRAHV